jgi:hypothetical protein
MTSNITGLFVNLKCVTFCYFKNYTTNIHKTAISIITITKMIGLQNKARNDFIITTTY